MANKTITTPENKARVLEQIGDGLSVRGICRMDDMPDRRTVYRWMANDDNFSHQCARACARRADTIFDEIFEIADDSRNDWIERLNYNGGVIGWELNGEHIQRSKLRIDARKWALSKMQPKKYGDKLNLNYGDIVVKLSSRDADL